MNIYEKSQDFRKRLEALPREDLLELIRAQSVDLYTDVFHIEEVFKTKLGHLTWKDGRPVLERPFTNEELALLIDEPFEPDATLTQMGLSVEQQRQVHIAKDPVTWAKHFLGASPRAYQVLMLRHPGKFKVLRAGRRLGKTWTMAVQLLHYSYTTNHGKSIVVTPMLTQAKLIFEEMMKLVKESEIVNSAIKRKVLNPTPEIKFSNESTVRFFTSGMKSGGKSDVTRGQEAHLIILDELDYMGDEDLEALLAMMQQTAENQAEKRMIGASTPSGRQAVFWKWCTDPKSKFREFWFPSYCNPFWDEETEEFLRSEHSEMGYRHEVEADWGEDADGVYPKRYLDLAFNSARLQYPHLEDPDEIREASDWEYVDQKTSATSTYIMGVDWDKFGAGTNIVVLEMFGSKHPDPFLRNRVRMAYREEVTREEYYLMAAVNRVIELNARFNPKHIYVDKGFGEVQVEMLHKHGVDFPESGLRTKVKGVSSASSIEVRDPHTKQKEKKEIKPFMVNNLRTMLEREQILFPSSDELTYGQLLAYTVIRTTILGRAVFEGSAKLGDHIHDALILACLAIEENYGDLMKSRYSNKAIPVSNEAFLGTFNLSDNEREREGEEILISQKWESRSQAPVAVRRAMSYNLRPGRKIRRRTF